MDSFSSTVMCLPVTCFWVALGSISFGGFWISSGSVLYDDIVIIAIAMTIPIPIPINFLSKWHNLMTLYFLRYKYGEIIFA